MRRVLSSFLFFLPGILFAQTQHIVLEGNIKDASDKPIPYATIQTIGTSEGVNADSRGHYTFKTTLPVVLKATDIGYKTQQKKITPEAGKDTIQVDFILAADSAQLQQVVVTAMHQPELVNESGTLEDFETNEHKLWLLHHYRKGDHLEIYDSVMNCLSRVILKHPSEHLTKTPYNYLYIENSDSVRLFDYNDANNSIDVGGVTHKEFRRFLHQLVTYHEPYYYYKWDLIDTSNVTYSYVDKDSGRNKMLYYYRNASIARYNDGILIEVYKLSTPELDENGMPEFIPSDVSEQKGYNPRVGEVSRNKESNVLVLHELMRHIFCPLRIIRDSIYIFNFDNDTMYVYTLNNKRVREIPISFNREASKFKNRDILVNEEGTECYYKFVVDGTTYLQKIDLNIGAKMNTQKLGFSFTEKIRIMNDYAYYTTSDAEDNGMFVRHLYRQKL